MSSIYKANDVRGKYPEEINEAIVKKIGFVLGKHFMLKPKTLNLKPVLAIGCDARLSSPILYKAVLDGIMNNGLRIRNKELNKKSKTIIHDSKFIIHKAGLMTTPMLYFLVNELKADGGIMVTASHNPKEYNGLKIVGKKAVPMSGSEILRIVNNEL